MKPEGRSPNLTIAAGFGFFRPSGFGLLLAALSRERSGSGFGLRISDFNRKEGEAILLGSRPQTGNCFCTSASRQACK
jgi:hypothetical protein